MKRRYLENTTNIFIRRDGSDSMGGDLNLSNNKIINVAYPTFSHDVAKSSADFVARPVITIWAQEVGPLNRGEYEWSFGNGEYTHAQCGYCVPALRLDDSRKHFLGP